MLLESGWNIYSCKYPYLEERKKVTVKLYQSKSKTQHWWKQKSSFNYLQRSFKKEKNPKPALFLDQICEHGNPFIFKGWVVRQYLVSLGNLCSFLDYILFLFIWLGLWISHPWKSSRPKWPGLVQDVLAHGWGLGAWCLLGSLPKPFSDSLIFRFL